MKKIIDFLNGYTVSHFVFSLMLIVLPTAIFFSHFGIAKVSGDSMLPTLTNGERLLLTKDIDNIEFGDVVVFKLNDKLLIKRIIGVPEDLIIIRDGFVYRNGELLRETYTLGYTYGDSEELIPNDCYFVLGDFRPNSKDSRYIGLVTNKSIIGKVVKKLD